MNKANEFREKALSMSTAMKVRAALRYEQAMYDAETAYRHGEARSDPYAFTKAVEALPVEVLVEVLSKKTRHELEKL